ncbi:MAG: hypothetical protein U0W24_08780 [Bacteroidales bacterium]
MALKLYLLIFIFQFSLSMNAQRGFVIDHRNTDLSKIPVKYIEEGKKKLKIQYFRRSHGSHLDVGGMAALRRYSDEYSKLYAYNPKGTNGELLFSASWQSLDFENDKWVKITRDFLDNPANSQINVVMWAWSSYLYKADADQYIKDMEALIADYGPGGTFVKNRKRKTPVVFIFQTGCSQSSAERNKELYTKNQKIREHCKKNNRILFDFNDIECYDPDGNYFGDGSPDGKYLGKNLLGDDLNYKTPGGRANWGIQWIQKNKDSELAKLSDDNICIKCEHSMGVHEGETKANSRLHCVLKGRAAWWMWAKLAGWNDASIK